MKRVMVKSLRQRMPRQFLKLVGDDSELTDENLLKMNGIGKGKKDK